MYAVSICQVLGGGGGKTETRAASLNSLANSGFIPESNGNKGSTGHLVQCNSVDLKSTPACLSSRLKWLRVKSLGM